MRALERENVMNNKLSNERMKWCEVEPEFIQCAWSDSAIIDYYDSHLNVTLRELASRTGRTVQELKSLLMGA